MGKRKAVGAAQAGAPKAAGEAGGWGAVLAADADDERNAADYVKAADGFFQELEEEEQEAAGTGTGAEATGDDSD